MGVELSRAGFVALAGRPNAGKSTLTNRLVGEKVTIVSTRPQTTRRAIRGILTTDEVQLVLTDLPGVQRPLDSLTTRMQRRVERELKETDAVMFVINAVEGVGPGDRFIASLLGDAGVPVIAAVNKIDRAPRADVEAALLDTEALGVAGSIVPVSARTGENLDRLISELQRSIPEGPVLFPADSVSDQPLSLELSELIREQVLRRTYRELPHAVEVEVDEMIVKPDGTRVIRALIYVDSESQKAIVVGRRGQMIKAIGTAARVGIESRLDCRIHLDLTVKPRSGWREDDALLDRLGIE